MSGLLSALNSAKTSIQSNQKAMDIIGNNIANANTEGYSRQSPVFTPVPSLNFRGFNIGLGVAVTDIARDYDELLVNQIQAKSIDVGENDAKSMPLTEIERIISVSETGISAEIDRFFDRWQELADNPSGSVERDLVIQQGDRLTASFHTAISDLDTVHDNLNSRIESKLNEINLKLDELHDLNTRVASIEAAGMTPNSALDQRDMVMADLSRMIGATFVMDGTQVTAQLPGGIPILQGGYRAEFTGNMVAGTLELELHAGSTVMPLNNENFQGEMRGFLDVRDVFIPEIKGDLDQLAYDISTTVNATHANGKGLDGIAGRGFFEQPATVSDAAFNFKVSITNSSHIAAGYSNSTADNQNANDIFALSREQIVSGTDTFVGFYSKIVAKGGVESGQNQLALLGNEDAIVQLKNLRDETSGVSLDEEMIRMIQYQRSFEASAKFLGAVDEMMQAILQI